MIKVNLYNIRSTSMSNTYVTLPFKYTLYTYVCKLVNSSFVVTRSMGKGDSVTEVSRRFLMSLQIDSTKAALANSITKFLNTLGTFKYDSERREITLYLTKNKDVVTSFYSLQKINPNLYVKILTKSQYNILYKQNSSDFLSQINYSIVDCFCNNEIPLDNVSRLYIMDRIFPNLRLPRGLIYDYVNQWHLKNNNQFVEIGIENPLGLSNINFMSEVVIVADYLIYIKKSLKRFQINNTLLLETKDKSHSDALNSKEETGQFNCDFKLEYKDTVTNSEFTIYVDIKQTESSGVDYQRRYLKLLYTNNSQLIEEYLHNVNLSIKTTLPEGYLINKNIDFLMRLNHLHEWLLINNQNKISLVFTKNLYIENTEYKDLESFITTELFSSNNVFNQTVHQIAMKTNAYVNNPTFQKLRENLTNPTALKESIGKTYKDNLPKFFPDITDNDSAS
jgi:hypothetical protein